MNINIQNSLKLSNRIKNFINNLIHLSTRYTNLQKFTLLKLATRLINNCVFKNSLSIRKAFSITNTLNLISYVYEDVSYTTYGERWQPYAKPKVLANGVDINDIITRIEIELNKHSENDSAVLYTKNIAEMPFPSDTYIDLIITDSNYDTLFRGKFIYPIKEPLKPNDENLYLIKAEPVSLTTQKIIIRNGKFNDYAHNIVIKLIRTYLPNVSTYGVKPCYKRLDLDLTNWNLFDALNFIADLCMYYFKIGYGRYGTDTLPIAFFKPADDFNVVNNLTINDYNFASATPFYYDMSQVYNKVRVYGKPIKQERGILHIIPSDSSITEFTINDEYEPYDIMVDLNNRTLEGRTISRSNNIVFKGTVEYVYYAPTKTIYFRNPIKGYLSIRYNVDVPLFVEASDPNSIAKYGLREHEDLVFDWIEDEGLLNEIAQTFIKYHKDPKLRGSVTCERSQLATLIYPGDKVYVNLSRYYIGEIVVGRVIHSIDNNRHWVTIETDTENIWDLFAKMLRRMREIDRFKNEVPPQIIIDKSDNAIEEKTEFVEVDLYIPDDIENQPIFKEIQLKTIFLEKPFIDWTIRVKDELTEEQQDWDWNRFFNEDFTVVTHITSTNPETLEPEIMTIEEFKNLTGIPWDINVEEKYVFHKLWYTNLGSYVEDPSMLKLVIRVTGYGAWKK
ncbi:MAG: hypothetical protein NC901_02875 [Candidatus Omnitrophica bacterium]|nr:hypothetical protein [Candidatus Omnitrophota bacterium]